MTAAFNIKWEYFILYIDYRLYIDRDHIRDQRQEARTIDVLNEVETNGRKFPGDIFKDIFLNANATILLKNSLKFVPKFPI